MRVGDVGEEAAESGHPGCRLLCAMLGLGEWGDVGEIHGPAGGALHPGSPQGPQPDPPGVDGSTGVRIAHLRASQDASDASGGTTFVRLLSRDSLRRGDMRAQRDR